MTSKFSIDNRELLQRISSGEAVVGIDFGNLIVRELAAFTLAAMDGDPVELPLDYLQGHKDGLEWAAQLAEANHPETGDWLYDDPIELAKAIRKGPDMPPVQPVADSEPVIVVGDDGGDALSYRRLIQSFEPGTKLYLHAQTAPEREQLAIENFRSAMEGIGHIRRTLEETFGGLHGTHVEPDVLAECKAICDAIYAAYRHAQQTVVQPMMFIDGDISSEDADKLAKVIREFNEEDERPLAKMARMIRENPHPTNECDMPKAQPAPVVSAELLHTAASAIEDLLTTKDRTGACVWFDLPFRLRSAANAHSAPVVPDDVSIFEAAIEECKTCDSIDEHAWNHGVLVVMAKYESCRAAMLNVGKS